MTQTEQAGRGRPARPTILSASGKTKWHWAFSLSLTLLAGLAALIGTLRAQNVEQRGAAEISLIGFEVSYSPTAHLGQKPDCSKAVEKGSWNGERCEPAPITCG